MALFPSTKISAMSPLLRSEVVAGDLVPIVDISLMQTKKIPFSELMLSDEGRKSNGWIDGVGFATLSPGTAFDFTGFPSWATEIEIIHWGISLSGTDNMLMQLGNAGSGFVTSGYVSGSGRIAGAVAGANMGTTGMIHTLAVAAEAFWGVTRFSRATAASNLWVSNHSLTSTVGVVQGTGALAIADLDRIRMTRTGTNTFDNGGSWSRYR